jgi:hypothetical protein
MEAVNMSDQIKLEDCPEILNDAVKGELAKGAEYNQSPKIISCVVHQSFNGENRTYKVYISTHNTFTILTYISNPRYYDIGIMENMVTIGEIKEILRAAPQYF